MGEGTAGLASSRFLRDERAPIGLINGYDNKAGLSCMQHGCFTDLGEEAKTYGYFKKVCMAEDTGGSSQPHSAFGSIDGVGCSAA